MMANKSSDIESTCSSENSSTRNSTERLKLSTGAKWKYFGFARAFCKTLVKCTLCKHEFNFGGNKTNYFHPEQWRVHPDKLLPPGAKAPRGVL